MTDFRIWRWGEYPQLSGGPTVIRRVYREEGRQEKQRRKHDDRRGVRFRDEFEECMQLTFKTKKDT